MIISYDGSILKIDGEGKSVEGDLSISIGSEVVDSLQVSNCIMNNGTINIKNIQHE